MRTRILLIILFANLYNAYSQQINLLPVGGGGGGGSNGPLCGTMVEPAIQTSTITYVSSTTANLSLTWNNAGEGSSYSIRYKLSGIGSYQFGCSSGATSCSISNLIVDRFYDIWVTASRDCDNSGISTSESIQSSTIKWIALPAPANPSAGNITANSFTASWVGVSGATGYRIDVASNPSFSTGIVYNNLAVSTTSQVVSGLTPNTTYYFRIRAVSASGTSASSQVFTLTTLVLLPPPTVVSASNISTSSFIASWTSVSGATSYGIDVSTSSSFSTNVFINDFPVNSLQFNVFTLTPGTTYYFRVRAKNATQTSANSQSVTVTTSALPPPPPVPTNVTTSSVNLNSFAISWSPADGATQYFVNVCTDTNFTTACTDLTVQTNTAQVLGLAPATLYYCRVRSNNIGGTSGYSTVATVTTVPAAPTNLSAGSTTTSIVTAWSASIGASSYRLDVSSSSSFSTDNVLTDATVSATSQTVTGLIAGTTYFFRVRAVNASGASSNSVTFALPTLPLAPVTLTTNSVSATSFVVTWSASTGAANYRLDVSSDASFSTGNVLTNATVSTTSQTVTGLTAGSTYFLRVRAVNASGVSANSLPLTVTLLPPAPIILAASNIGTQSFTANWQGIITNHVYVDVLSEALPNPLVYNNLDAGTGNSLVITGLISGVPYYYRVRQVNSTGTSPNSNNSPIVTPNLSTPVMLPPESITSGSAVVKWNATPEASMYLLDVSSDPQFSSFVSGYNTKIIPTLDHTVVGLGDSTKYYFRVRAANNNTVSGFSSFVSAQTSNLQGTIDRPFEIKIVPPSPEAAALAKYADIPVSMYSGTPNISIPLYTVQEHGLSLPVSMSYHGSGNKVETVAPRTGLGWALNAGGVVTRSVRGWPDEWSPNGFLSTARDFEIGDFALGTPQQQVQWYYAMADGCFDTEPDLFYFNFAGYTGTFMYDWDGKIKMLSGNSIKIESTPLINGFFGGWEITVDDGTKFRFLAMEKTAMLESSFKQISCNMGVEDKMPQAWYLTEMIAAEGPARIQFEYTPYIQNNVIWSTEMIVHDIFTTQGVYTTQRLEALIQGLHLSRITTSSGQTTISFLPASIPRTDVTSSRFFEQNPVRDNFALGQINISNVNAKEVKKYDFTYNYNTGRLTLESLTESGGGERKPPYEFSYTGGLPEPTSYSRDHWGFFNANSGTLDNGVATLIPATKYPLLGGGVLDYSGADRSPDRNLVLAGMLKEIKYPTGGKDILEFESHDYSFEQNKELLVHQILIGGSASVSAPSDIISPGSSVADFTLPADAVNQKLSGNWGFTAAFGGGLATVRIQDAAGRTVVGPYGLSQNSGSPNAGLVLDLSLPPGNYKLIGSATAPHCPDCGENSVDAIVSWSRSSEVVTTEMRAGGGVRIAKITRNFSNANPDKIIKYRYRITEDAREKSSGSLLESGYTYESPMQYIKSMPGGSTSPFETEEGKFVRWAQNKSSLGTTQGSHVGYSDVMMLQGENGENGRSEFHFTSPRDVQNFDWGFPFPPAYNPDHLRGLLLKQSDFAANSNDTLVSVINTYSSFNYDVPAIKVGILKPGGVLRSVLTLDRLDVNSYETALGYTRLIKTRERVKQPGFPTIETVTGYKYNETTHKQLIKSSVANSEGDTIVTSLKYPLDYAVSTDAVTQLKTDHIDNTLVEKVIYKKSKTNQINLLSGIFTDFGRNNDIISPRFKYSAKIATPLSTTDPFATVKNLYEARLAFYAFDAFNNIKEVGPIDGNHTSYQWNYNGTLVTAEVKNATYRQIFYESFEEDITATSSMLEKRTGKKSKVMSGGVYTVPNNSRPNVNGNYILSYWKKVGTSSWVYEEKQISNYVVGTAITSNAVSGYIDDVRLYPKNALMTTYTYEPLVGVTSITDAANVTIYYEYDDLGRLKCSRDQNHNIIECYDYQYQVEVPFPVQN
jgi:YD repeat-containing protein